MNCKSKKKLENIAPTPEVWIFPRLRIKLMDGWLMDQPLPITYQHSFLS
jgi:hypothetical protein